MAAFAGIPARANLRARTELARLAFVIAKTTRVRERLAGIARAHSSGTIRVHLAAGDAGDVVQHPSVPIAVGIEILPAAVGLAGAVATVPSALPARAALDG